MAVVDLKFEAVRDSLRGWREDNSRRSEEVVDLWTDCLQHHKHRLADERWRVEEQVFVAALDCNRLDVADQCLLTLRNNFPNSLRVARLRAMRLEAVERFDEAVIQYERIVREDETNSTARKRKVAVLRGQGRYTEAVSALTDYLAKFMSDGEAWQELSELYLKEGDYGKAAFCVEELILTNPHNSLYYARYAEIKFTQGGVENMEIAKTYYCQAIKLNPKNLRALYGLHLSCHMLASSSKVNSNKKKDIIKLAEFADQKIKQRYAEEAARSGGAEAAVLDAVAALSITE